jgi:hypothetical protein
MTKEALKLALEALETNNKAWKHLADSGDAGFWEAEEQGFYELSVKAITAIKEALAQPEHGWTPERIAGMARLKEAQDKKLAQPEQPKVRTGNCLRVGVCASEGHKIAPQRKPLTDEEILTYRHMIDWTAEWSYINFARAIEVAHGIKGQA